MKVLHISAECYPAAKAGGLGDVVGALPKYLNKAGLSTGVVIPKYRLKWFEGKTFQSVYQGVVRLHNWHIPFSIQQFTGDSLGFPFFVADIPGLFDRAGVYADPDGQNYSDEVERYLAFQQAVLQWIVNSPGKPALLHCHDHHTGLIPFMVKHCPEYRSLQRIPTVFTIHNGAYHGNYGWDKMYLLPFFDAEARGLLDWRHTINPLATAIKCAWRVTTVSPSYLEELREDSNGMEALLQHERHKCLGIINGIDTQVWSPKEDPFLLYNWTGSLADFKQSNKAALGPRFRIDLKLPLVTFIGRLVGEKGADLLPDLIDRVLQSGMQVAFAVLGTGQHWIHDAFRHLANRYPGRFDVVLEYNEGLAHQLYAGSDFLMMPSRVEPCGLNQMYAMRYGTLPIVRSVGGLKDTVPDIGVPNNEGRGIRFTHFNLDDGHIAIYRAVELFHNRAVFEDIRQRITEMDFSWERSAADYREVYEQMI
ncbi:MAG: glycogen synthase [Phaeodactylibacter xiamenensis]|uniref:Glycogen synthase n=1 Tax=Phaeodactylibacter xiamenensis TaxID=1524460 RepID=A0A098SAI8_9BACT|nr:glycogen/starch synthase [Phaeodactylibacter xiamenensis]KGE89151.1 glycogen synthase [Phaeodactylibacter xiamenensis]MCR9050311.1 glycogen/starch synthase [bacterium]